MRLAILFAAMFTRVRQRIPISKVNLRCFLFFFPKGTVSSSPQAQVGVWLGPTYLCGPKAVVFLGQSACAEALRIGALGPTARRLLWVGYSSWGCRPGHAIGGRSIFQHTWGRETGHGTRVLPQTSPKSVENFQPKRRKSHQKSHHAK